MPVNDPPAETIPSELASMLFGSSNRRPGASGFTLDADQLRELGVALEFTQFADPILERVANMAVWGDLVSATRHAKAAHPACPACEGYGRIDLPRVQRYGPDPADIDVDIEQHPCPVCRPWAGGFPGLKRSGVGMGAAITAHGMWTIPPYRAGRRPETYNGEPVTLAWDDEGCPC